MIAVMVRGKRLGICVSLARFARFACVLSNLISKSAILAKKSAQKAICPDAKSCEKPKSGVFSSFREKVLIYFVKDCRLSRVFENEGFVNYSEKSRGLFRKKS